MGKYPEAEDRDSTVVNLETYRQRRAAMRHDHDIDAGQKPHDDGNDGPGPRNAPVEGNRKD